MSTFEHREPAWRRYLRLVRPNPKADLEDELRDHIESTVEGLVADGMTVADARAEAHRRLGNVSSYRRQVERLDARHEAHVNRVAWLETVLYDARHAVRGLRRNTAFTLI